MEGVELCVHNRSAEARANVVLYSWTAIVQNATLHLSQTYNLALSVWQASISGIGMRLGSQNFVFQAFTAILRAVLPQALVDLMSACACPKLCVYVCVCVRACVYSELFYNSDEVRYLNRTVLTHVHNYPVNTHLWCPSVAACNALEN